MPEHLASEGPPRTPTKRATGAGIVLVFVCLIGWFGWSVGRAGPLPVFLLPPDVGSGDVVLSGSFDTDYQICAIGPYESCGVGCSVPEYEILYQAIGQDDDVLWQQSFARGFTLGERLGSTEPSEGRIVSFGFLKGYCLEKKAFRSFRLVAKDVQTKPTETSILLDLQ
jgi:hypothetical protein